MAAACIADWSGWRLSGQTLDGWRTVTNNGLGACAFVCSMCAAFNCDLVVRSLLCSALSHVYLCDLSLLSVQDEASEATVLQVVGQVERRAKEPVLMNERAGSDFSV